MSAPAERYHALDALRAFALLLGICLHGAMPFIASPRDWAVGTDSPAAVPGIFAYYVHCARMPVFFVLAGFFARLVVERRGLGAFLRDRFVRIALVFAVALYPVKFALSALWVLGGWHVRTLNLPPEVLAQPWWQLGLGGPLSERWPSINLTHLWFLYYLVCITGLFVALHQLARPVAAALPALRRGTDAAFRRLAAPALAPVALATAVFPLIASMRKGDIDTPDAGFHWHLPVLTLYGLFFTLGWLLHRHRDLLASLARRWRPLLAGSLACGLVSLAAVALRRSGGETAAQHAVLLRWAAAAGTSLTMGFAIPAWFAVFMRFANRPHPWVRYLADSSYWIYLVHLPLVVALQVWFARWGAPWWIQWPLLNAIAFPVLLLSYHLLVRRTWIGAWLNGRRLAPPPGGAGGTPDFPPALTSSRAAPASGRSATE